MSKRWARSFVRSPLHQPSVGVGLYGAPAGAGLVGPHGAPSRNPAVSPDVLAQLLVRLVDVRWVVRAADRWKRRRVSSCPRRRPRNHDVTGGQVGTPGVFRCRRRAGEDDVAVRSGTIQDSTRSVRQWRKSCSSCSTPSLSPFTDSDSFQVHRIGHQAAGTIAGRRQQPAYISCVAVREERKVVASAKSRIDRSFAIENRRSRRSRRRH